MVRKITQNLKVNDQQQKKEEEEEGEEGKKNEKMSIIKTIRIHKF